MKDSDSLLDVMIKEAFQNTKVRRNHKGKTNTFNHIKIKIKFKSK